MKPGDEVFVYPADSIVGGTIEKRTIKQFLNEEQTKVEMMDGSMWRIDGVFPTLEEATFARRKDAIPIELHPDDLQLILYSLAQELKSIMMEVAVLRRLECGAQHLTSCEIAMLPYQLRKLSKEELLEQLNHWFSLQQNYTYLIKQLDAQLVQAKKDKNPA